jgi:hypothetical protein
LAFALTSSIPFFRASGENRDVAGREHLGLISGFLLYDSGEAEETFLYRCQDRYVTYNSLCGLRTVLFVADEKHRNRYRQLLANHDYRTRLIRERTGIRLPCTPSPWFAALSLHRLQPVAFPASYMLALNQVSPSCALVAGEELREQGELALAWHDKSRYLQAAQAAPDGLPRHATTALISTEEFSRLRSWHHLAGTWRERTGRAVPHALYVKSSCDSGGNVAVRLCPTRFDQASRQLRVSLRRGPDLAQLRADLSLPPSLANWSWSESRMHTLLRNQRTRRGAVQLLIQEAIECPEDSDIQGLGVTCHITSAHHAEIVAAAGQMYRDSDRHHFLGSYVGGLTLGPRLDRQVRALCALLGREGYRGPVNFDARRSATGEWVFLYDCNPRLSAIYPALAVREYLASKGYDVQTVANFGYRGEFAQPDLAKTLTELNRIGLLYRDDRPVGILPLPNLAREHGLDLAMVNVPYRELGAVAARCQEASGLGVHVF